MSYADFKRRCDEAVVENRVEAYAAQVGVLSSLMTVELLASVDAAIAPHGRGCQGQPHKLRVARCIAQRLLIGLDEAVRALGYDMETGQAAHPEGARMPGEGGGR